MYNKTNPKYTDYNDAKIYKITSSQTNEIYIGSTCQTLNKRFSKHFSENDSTSKKITQYEDCKIELIENFPCKNDNELKKEKDILLKIHLIVLIKVFQEELQRNTVKIIKRFFLKRRRNIMKKIKIQLLKNKRNIVSKIKIKLLNIINNIINRTKNSFSKKQNDIMQIIEILFWRKRNNIMIKTKTLLRKNLNNIMQIIEIEYY